MYRTTHLIKVVIEQVVLLGVEILILNQLECKSGQEWVFRVYEPGVSLFKACRNLQVGPGINSIRQWLFSDSNTSVIEGGLRNFQFLLTARRVAIGMWDRMVWAVGGQGENRGEKSCKCRPQGL